MTIELDRTTVQPAITLPSDLWVRTHRPESGTAVVEVGGDLDAAGAPRLAELLEARANSTLRRLVIDLTEVGFLSAAGLSALEHGYLRACQHQILCTVRVSAGSPILCTIGFFPLRFREAIEVC
ncbi:STAS domain-containing protein [Amycolatopsis sp. NPDC049159]|uniref:STAS domain-containing protein n=1 Tax=Amycolatopsis sp. NPDC049159 TaxID=3157210 RepID=UPI0033C1C352